MTKIVLRTRRQMNWTLFKDILSIDSTSGKERDMALWLHDHLEATHKELMEVGDGTLNLFLKWGTPRVVFCTHMDTVPPYIAPSFPEERVHRSIGHNGTCARKRRPFGEREHRIQQAF